MAGGFQGKKKSPPRPPSGTGSDFLVLSGVRLLGVPAFFAGLVGHAAGGFAGRLARGLAFAAAAVLFALGEIAGVEGLKTFHRLHHLQNIGAEGTNRPLSRSFPIVTAQGGLCQSVTANLSQID